MEELVNWDEVILYADECISKIEYLMHRYPGNGGDCSQAMATIMFHKLQAITAKKIEEDNQERCVLEWKS